MLLLRVHNRRVPRTATHRTSPMPPRPAPDRFKVAFSFAGEQRDLVRAIAQSVEARPALKHNPAAG